MVNIRKVSSGHCPPRKVLLPVLERRYTKKIAGEGEEMSFLGWGKYWFLDYPTAPPSAQKQKEGKKVLAVGQRSRIFSPMGSALLCLRIRRHGCPGPNLRDSDADDLSLDPDTSSLTPQVIVCPAKTPEFSIAINMVWKATRPWVFENKYDGAPPLK